MKIDGILFDINGTLIDIHTDEHYEEIYRSLGNFLSYQGIAIDRWALRDEYFSIMSEQKKASGEAHPEFDVVEVWREFLRRRSDLTRAMPRRIRESMPLFMAEMFRSMSLFRLQLYPDVRATLDWLSERFKLAALSDAQSAWALPEIRAVGIDHYFSPIVVSGDLGFRKPDKRIFELALKAMGLSPGNVVLVGNDMYRDIYGAREYGMKTVFFSSNQGRKSMEAVEPDYIIYRLAELRQAVEFFTGR